MDEVLAAVGRLALTPTLVVACDFDGALAPLVDEPMTARAVPSAVDALTVLAGLPATHAALLSGRSRAALGELAAASRIPGAVGLIGSHGWEVDGESGAGESGAGGVAERRLHTAVVEAVEQIAAAFDGVRIEIKPASATVHYRTVAPARRSAVLAAIEAGPVRLPGVHVLRGKDVVEFAVVQVDKGVALARLRRREGATAVFFVGDDVTDEHAFAVLGPDDVGVKVGPGETAAGWRVDDPAAVGEVLLALAAARAAHVRE